MGLKYSIYLFKILLNNAYILYNECNNKKIRKLDFLLKIFELLVEESGGNGFENCQNQHLPLKQNSRKSCAHRKSGATTVFICSYCEVYLCVKNCFYEYHVDLKQKGEDFDLSSDK
jgi:hypothetical protein